MAILLANGKKLIQTHIPRVAIREVGRVHNILRSVGRYDVVTHGHVLLSNFLVGEVRRDCSQAPGVPSIGVGGGNGCGCKEAKEKLPFIHRAWRFTGVKQSGNKTMVNVIEEDEELNFYPYVFTPRGIAPPPFL